MLKDITDGLVAAHAVSGDMIFIGILPKFPENTLLVPNPVKVLFSGAWNFIRGIGAAFKDKKKWIPALILAVTWFVLTLLPNNVRH